MSGLITSLNSGDVDFTHQLDALLARGGEADLEVEATVSGIIDEVRRRGDEALVEFTRQFDQLDISDAAALELPPQRLRSALDQLEPELRSAIEASAARIKAYHEYQKQESWHYEEEDGTLLGQQVTPIERVGLYVPGGKAAYPSSVLMTAIPAVVAGVSELVMVVPTPGGELNQAVLAAASLSGVDRVFTVGGAQAIAALAFGTKTLPRVDKIVGPGNIYVATAKRQVFGQVGIDMIAGPSEIVVICDQTADPEWVAMDLFAQAEHDERAQSIVITPVPELAGEIRKAIANLLPEMERREIIATALSNQGAIIEVSSMDEAVRVSDRIAPEHLELMVDQPLQLAREIRNAGALFVGKFSAESLGDYCAGPNHVLPTAGTARFSSPLGVYDFQTRSSLIMCSEQGADHLGRVASKVARAEHLTAHARSAELRIKRNNSDER